MYRRFKMTESEAIKELHKIRPRGGIIPQKRAEAIDMAINALEKQIPKSWIRNEYFDGEYTWECPCCKEEYVLIEGGVLENGYSYCPSCGQKLDWSDTD